jgi:hypothetical protein
MDEGRVGGCGSVISGDHSASTMHSLPTRCSNSGDDVVDWLCEFLAIQQDPEGAPNVGASVDGVIAALTVCRV